MEVNPNRQLLPFFFTETLTGYILLVNQGGEYLFIKKEEFDLILSNKIRIGSLLYNRLKNKQFLADNNDIGIQLSLLANQLKSRKAYLEDFTSLHMIVVTARCNFSCRYCHASSVQENESNLDLGWDNAKCIVDKIFESPSPIIKIEFQGGEPLLSWPVI